MSKFLNPSCARAGTMHTGPPCAWALYRVHGTPVRTGILSPCARGLRFLVLKVGRGGGSGSFPPIRPLHSPESLQRRRRRLPSPELLQASSGFFLGGSASRWGPPPVGLASLVYLLVFLSFSLALGFLCSLDSIGLNCW